MIELVFRTEHQTARAGVQAVGADHHVVPAAVAAPELDLDAGAVIFKCFDRVVEAVADRALLGEIVKHLGERTARQFDIAVSLIIGEIIRRDCPDRAPFGIDEPQLPRVDMLGLCARKEAHSLDYADRSAPHLNRVAAAAKRRRSLDHRHVETVAIEPVGQRWPGDAGAGDEDRA
jgi:hypothetical protein